MVACILIADGSTADEAMQLIAGKRPVADPYAWHIQRWIKGFEAEWKTSNSSHKHQSDLAHMPVSNEK
jgi:hypothetical protein